MMLDRPEEYKGITEKYLKKKKKAELISIVIKMDKIMTFVLDEGDKVLVAKAKAERTKDILARQNVNLKIELWLFIIVSVTTTVLVLMALRSAI